MTDILWHIGIGDFTFTDRDLRRRFPNDRRHVLNRRAETDYMQRGFRKKIDIVDSSGLDNRWLWYLV